MKLDNLYFVESPLQALCALEVSLSLPDETHGIIVRLANTELRRRNDQQIQEVMGLRKWDYYHRINSHNRGHALFNYLYYRSQLIKLKKRFSGRVNRLYVGEFRTGLMHQVRGVVKAKQDYLLDDGTVTIEIVNDYLSKGVFYKLPELKKDSSSFKSIVLKLIFYGLYEIKLIDRPLILKTVYDFPGYKYTEKIDFTYLNKMYEDAEYADKVYFFGSKYSEASLLSLEDEFIFLTKVKKYFRGKEIVYMAHRDESINKIDKIKKELKINVIIPDSLAELTLLRSKKRPRIVATACSSVLPNFLIMFPQIELISFKLNIEEIIRPEAIDGIKYTYDYFEKIGIPVVDLYKAQGD